MNARPLKFAVLTSNSYFSFVILSEFLSRYRDHIGAVIETHGLMKGRGPIATLGTVLRHSGMSGTIYKVGTALYSRALDALVALLPGRHAPYSPLTLARRLGIPVYVVRDANAGPCLALLRGQTPDLVFAVNVYQLLRSPVLEIPRLGVVNLHFGMLPDYRGMSPYMWALANGERQIGITAHFMDATFDTGNIITQRPVPIREHDSALGLYLRSCLAARPLLAEIARAAEEDRLSGSPQPAGAGVYYGLPDRRCVAAIRRRGHVLARWSDLLRIARHRIEGPAGS